MASTGLTALAQGVYKFQLKVTDNKGATGLDTVQITVNPANFSPIANAGTDQSITLPTNRVTLSGSGTDPDGFISSYKWTKISGGAATISSSTSKTTLVTGLSQGTYKFELAVTDNKGAVGKDTMQVIVKPAGLTADAGTMAFTGESVGSGGEIVVYQNVPNPFSDVTTIRYDVPAKALVKIMVYNSAGIEVAVLANEVKQPGSYQVQWNAGNIASGQYFYTVMIGENEITRKMLKLN